MAIKVIVQRREVKLGKTPDHGVGSSDHIQKSVIFIVIHYLFHLHFHLYFVYLEK